MKFLAPPPSEVKKKKHCRCTSSNSWIICNFLKEPPSVTVTGPAMKPDVVEPSAYIPQEHGSAAIWSSLTEDTGPVTAVVKGRSSSYVNLVSAINFD